MSTLPTIDEDEVRYRIVVHDPPPFRKYDHAASRLHYWYGNRNYSTMAGVNSVLSRVKRLNDAENLRYHIEIGKISWNWEAYNG